MSSEVLPRKCFISYAYKDRVPRKYLLRNLPTKVKPYLFPQINVPPDDMVSNSLIEAILEQDGLIYVEGGHSEKSFWVAFERDYALRAGKPVYSFNPKALTFTPHTLPCIQLPVFVSHSPYDRDKVDSIMHFMRDKRFFDALSFGFLPSSRVPADKQIRSSIIEKISRGGYLVVFWSEYSAKSDFVENEMQLALEYGQYYAGVESSPDFSRVLFALLDNTPLPGWLQKHMANPGESVKPVQLYSDNERSETNRIDDLIVRLYWLIYRNTQNNGL